MHRVRGRERVDRPVRVHRPIVLLGASMTAMAVVLATVGLLCNAQVRELNVAVERDLADVETMDSFVVALAAFAESAVPGPVEPDDDTAPDLLTTQLAAQELLASGRAGASAQALAEAIRAFQSAVTAAIGTQPAMGGRELVADASVSSAFVDALTLGRQVASDVRASREVHQAAARRARTDLDHAFVVGGLFALVVGITMTLVLARAARREERDFALRDGERRRDHRRNEFEAALQRGLEMVRVEPGIYGLLAEALHQVAPSTPVTVLMADSSRSHFRHVASSSPAASDTVCGVASPAECPATSGGQTLVFPASSALDACPHLRGRANGCSAVCVPLSIAGNSIGVVHAVSPDGQPLGHDGVSDIEVAVRKSSERLAMLRSFEQSQSQASTDSLTGLLNRRSLEARMAELAQRGVSYSVAFGDLDHFKLINDVHGHETGDRALRLFSQVLRESVRPDDTVARYGGEEFVIVLPDCDLDETVAVLERARCDLAIALHSGRVPAFTVSFGCAEGRDMTGDALIAAADAALLEAKRRGRDCVVRNDEIRARASIHRPTELDASAVG